MLLRFQDKEKASKALKTFLQPELIDFLKKKLKASMTIPMREYIIKSSLTIKSTNQIK